MPIGPWDTAGADRGFIDERELIVLYLLGLAVFLGALLLLNL